MGKPLRLPEKNISPKLNTNIKSKKMETLKKVNVAPTSNEGHFIEKAKNVINLDVLTESYFVEGKSILTTKNHTTLKMEEDCLVNCQMIYNPFSKMYQRSKD